jgi:hypothetical protein
MDGVKEFLIVDELFTRYTIVVGLTSRITSVYCDECDVWVVEYDGDHLSTQTTLDLFEMVVNEHDEQKHGQLIEFNEWTERFK